MTLMCASCKKVVLSSETEESCKCRSAVGALKYDDEKVDLSILPRAGLDAAARAFMYGAKKYARDNYKQGMKFSRLVSALMRHVTAWNEGEDRDSESGLSHVDHTLACAMMLAYYLANERGTDDRFKPLDKHTSTKIQL